MTTLGRLSFNQLEKSYATYYLTSNYWRDGLFVVVYTSLCDLSVADSFISPKSLAHFTVEEVSSRHSLLISYFCSPLAEVNIACHLFKRPHVDLINFQITLPAKSVFKSSYKLTVTVSSLAYVQKPARA